MNPRPFVQVDPADQEALIRKLGPDKARTAFMLWFRLNLEAFRARNDTVQLPLSALQHDTGITRRHLPTIIQGLEVEGFIQVTRQTRKTLDGHTENETNIYRLRRGAYSGKELNAPPGELSSLPGEPGSPPREDISGHVPGNEFPTSSRSTRITIPPIVPPGTVSRRLSETEKKRLKVSNNTPVMIRIGSWFNRRSSTPWTLYEAEALHGLGEIPEDVLAIMEGYYRSAIPQKDDIRRRDLGTLLNNWTGELDRARKHAQAVQTHPGQRPDGLVM